MMAQLLSQEMQGNKEENPHVISSKNPVLSCHKTVVLTVGNVLRADDGAGPLLAELLERKPIEGITVIDGGMVPENTTSFIRREAPDLLIIVDAAEMGCAPGTICRVLEEDIASQLFITTHSLPLSFLINNLKESVQDIVFVGIQPQLIELFESITPAVSDAVNVLYDYLQAGIDLHELPTSRESISGSDEVCSEDR